MKFELSNSGFRPPVYGPVSSMLRARLYGPGVDTSFSEIGLTEDVSTPTYARQYYGASPDLGILPDSSVQYQYEVRKVSSQTTGGFDASTEIVIDRGDYGVPQNGSWEEFSPYPTGPSDPTSGLIDYEEFLARFGIRNVARHSDTNADTQTEPDRTRVQFAFDEAANEIENFFTGGCYEIPFVFSGSVPAIVRKWAMNLAYADLYLARGQSDEKQPTKIQLMRQNTLNEMALYRSGLRNLPTASRRSGDDSSANIVKAHDVRIGSCRPPDGQPVYGWTLP